MEFSWIGFSEILIEINFALGHPPKLIEQN